MADAPAVPATPPATPPSAPPPTPPAAPPSTPATPPTSATPPAAPPTTPPATPTTPPSTPPASVGTWRDDWRGALAKGDEKGVKHLERYSSPEAVYDALKSAQDSIAKHGLRIAPPAADATPEQIAEYRKANGIPESADKYDLTLADGLVLGDADKPIAEHFTKFVHGKNWSNDQVKQGLEWYYQYADHQREQTENADALFKEQSIAKLGEQWGAQYGRNVRMVDDFLKSAPPEVADNLWAARLPNGRLLGADPAILGWLFEQAHFRNPQATVMGGNSETQVKAAEARKAEIEQMMRTDRKAYFKNAAVQEEYRKLTEGLTAVKGQRR